MQYNYYNYFLVYMTIKCRICENKIYKPKIIFKKYPLSLWPCKKNNSIKNLDLKVFFCKKCSLIQLQRFRESTINLLYKEQKVLLNQNLIKDRISRIKSFLKINKKSRILEIGGGRNNVIKYLKKSEKWICDFDIKKYDKDINFVKKKFEKFKGKINYFDYIFFFHTLEHIENPKTFLKNVSDKLTDDGNIFLEIPNIKYYLRQIPYYAFFFQHQSLFSLNTLKNLAHKANLRVHKLISKPTEGVILIILKKNKVQKKLIIEKSIVDNLNLKIISRINKIKYLIKNYSIKKIALYGCGGASMTFYYHLRNNKILIDGFYDADIKKINLHIPISNKVVKNGIFFNHKSYDLVITTSNSIKSFLEKKYKNINTISLQ